MRSSDCSFKFSARSLANSISSSAIDFPCGTILLGKLDGIVGFDKQDVMAEASLSVFVKDLFFFGEAVDLVADNFVGDNFL